MAESLYRRTVRSVLENIRPCEWCTPEERCKACTMEAEVYADAAINGIFPPLP